MTAEPINAVVESPHLTATSANLAREWTRSQRSILAFIGSLVYDFNEAEELLQETAAQVFSHVERYDHSRPFLPWALGIAHHVVLNHHRNRARDRHVFDQEAVARLARAFEDISERQDELRQALPGCREKLPARSRQVCWMRYEGGLSPREIARRLGTTSGMVRTRLHRIREQLRRCIQQQLELGERRVPAR